MILAATQQDAAMLPDRLHRRAAELGLALVKLGDDGSAAACGALGWAERMLIGSSLFASRVRSEWESLAAGHGKAVALWDGVWLAPLPGSRRRRSGSERQVRTMTAALLLGPELLDAEEFQAICGEQRLDHRAATAKADPSRLVGAAEAARIAAMLAWMHEDSHEIERALGDTRQLSQQLAGSYEELALLYRLSTTMTVDQPPQQFLADACEELQQVVGLPWMAIQIVDEEPRLAGLAGRVFTSGPITCDLPTLRRIGSALLQRTVDESEPCIFDRAADLNIDGLTALSGNLIIVPLRCEGRVVAIVFGGALDAHVRQITTSDAKLCSSLAGSLTIFLQNLMLYEDMQAMFLGTLHALTSAIDAKDSYTRGHSERVALLSKMLAEATGLDAHTVERVYVAGLVHDVGKIGVPEAVLSKPGKLTDEEFALIKLHPEIGARILQDIRQMQDLIPGVLHHHEKWNGRGYPHGLAGEAIPLFGRLVGLADAFDAMSSNRTYRAALSRDHVLGEVRKCSEQQFDPKLVEVFVTLDFGPFDRLIQRHQEGAAV